MHQANTDTFDLDLACIPSSYSRLVARELQLQSRDLPKLLQHTGVLTEQFLQEDTLLTPRQQIQILENSLTLTNNPAFCLQMGKRFTAPTHGAMGFLLNSSPNLITAIKGLQTFLPTRMNLARLELHYRSDWIELTCQFAPNISGQVLKALSEICAIIFCDCAEFIIGPEVNELELYFAHDKPDYYKEYEYYLPGKIEFGCPSIMVRLPQQLGEIANVSANQETYLLAHQQCESMLLQLNTNRNSCQYQIQKLMLTGALNALNEEEVAAALFISKRTLARRLKKEGSSFREIRDHILSQQAAAYLRESTLSVDAIAALLNYHDSSNFRRAFKRWFKMTPDQFRKQAQMDKPAMLTSRHNAG